MSRECVRIEIALFDKRTEKCALYEQPEGLRGEKVCIKETRLIFLGGNNNDNILNIECEWYDGTWKI